MPRASIVVAAAGIPDHRVRLLSTLAAARKPIVDIAAPSAISTHRVNNFC
jgi:hypothetical protein